MIYYIYINNNNNNNNLWDYIWAAFKKHFCMWSCSLQVSIVSTSNDGCNCAISRTYLPNILLTHPCDTLNCLLISQGRTPFWASSTIFLLMRSGRGRPFTNTPPSWFTPPWPFEPLAILICSKSIPSVGLVK